MIKARLRLPDGRDIPVLIRERTYKKLTIKLNNLSFWGRFKLLFLNKGGKYGQRR